MNDITASEYDYSWVTSPSTKSALIKHGESLWKHSRGHQHATMDLAKLYYEQKVMLVDAALERRDCHGADALLERLADNNYNLDALPNEEGTSLAQNWAAWCASDACFHEPSTVGRFLQLHVNLGEFEISKLANFTSGALRSLGREHMPHEFLENILDTASTTEQKWDKGRLQEYYEESDLPTRSEANERARKHREETGNRMIVLARDGKMYSGMTGEEVQDRNEKAERTYGLQRAVKQVAEIAARLTPQQWVAEQLGYQKRHLRRYDEIKQVTQWLTELVEVLEPAAAEYDEKTNGAQDARKA